MSALFDRVYNVIKTLDVKGYIQPSFRVWTRGDGARYKDWDRIKASQTDINKLISHLEQNATKKISVKGEFGDSDYQRAVILDDVVYIMWDSFVEFGSLSRLRNTSVWKSKERND